MPFVATRRHRRNVLRPSLVYEFAKQGISEISGEVPLTYTRTGNATYFDSTGTLQTAGANVAPFDHNPTTLASLGLSVWEARTNIALYNRDIPTGITAANWVATNISAAKNQTGIDGTANSASTLTATAGNGTLLQTVTLASSARFMSAYVKRVTGTGTVNMTTDNGATWTEITVTSAWTRVTIPTQTLANPVFGFQIVTDADAIAVDYIQNENGTFATPAILVTDAAATRSAPAISTTDLSWFNASEGTFVVQFDSQATAFTNSRVWQLDGGNENNRILQSLTSTTSQSSIWTVSAAAQATINTTTATVASQRKIATAWAVGDAAISASGAAVITGTPAAIPTVTTLRLGQRTDTSAQTMLNGHISYLAYYPRRLPNATLQRLSV